MVRTQEVTDSITEAFSFLGANWRPLCTSFAKAHLLSLGAFLAIALAGAVVGAGAYFGFKDSAPVALVVVLIGWAVLVFIAAAIASRIASSAAYNILDSRVRNVEIGVVEAAGANAWPMTRFVMLHFLIEMAVMAPFLILGAIAYLGIAVAVPGIGASLGEMAFDIMRFAAYVPLAVVALFLAFAIYELLIARRGAIESIGRSVHLVKTNFFETFILLFLLYFVRQAVVVPLLVAAAIVVLPLFFGTLFVGGALGTSTIPGIAAMAAGFALTALAVVAAGVAFAVVDDAVTLPPVYSFWGRIRKRAAP